MRRVFLYFLLLCAAPGVYSNDWGVLSDFASDTEHKYAMDFLIQGKTIRYSATEEITQEEKDIFAANLKKWPQEVWKAIEDAKRTEEFKDIKSFLLTPDFKLEETDKQPDITLKIDDHKKGIRGYFSDVKYPFEIAVVRKHREIFDHVTLHEIGHYFGLGDQYTAARHNSHEEYSSDVNKEQGSVMNYNDTLTCDDIDGFINTLDLRLAQYSGHFSERAQKGWNTLCSEGTNLYQNSQTLNRNATDTVAYRRGVDKILRFYKNGQMTAKMTAPDPAQIFDVKASTVTRDPQTGLISAITTPITMAVQDPADKNIFIEEKNNAEWTRTFTYRIKSKRPKKTSFVSVTIKEEINKIPFRQLNIIIEPNGSLMSVDSNGQYYRIWDFGDFENKPNMKTHVIHDTFQKKEINHRTREVSLSKIEVDFVIENGKVKSFRSRHDEPLLAELCRPRIRYIESFYKNFYEPLFAPNKSTVESRPDAKRIADDIQKNFKAAHQPQADKRQLPLRK